MARSAALDGDVLPVAVPVHAALSPIHPPDPLSSSTAVDMPDPLKSPSSPTEMGRSASYGHLPSLEKESPVPPIKRTFSANGLSLPASESRSRNAAVDENVHSANRELFRRASKKAKRKMSGARWSLSAEDENDAAASASDKASSGYTLDPAKSLGRSVTTTIRSLARKSWAPSSASRSPTPDPRDDDAKLEKKRSWSPIKNKAEKAADAITVPEPVKAKAPSPRSSTPDVPPATPMDDKEPLGDKEKLAAPVTRPMSVMIPKSASQISLKRLSRNSSSTSLKSFSSAERSQSRSRSARPGVPLPSTSSERLSTLHVEMPKKRDPLWAQFRNIESELVTFQAKTSLQKAKVLRGSLLPFLSKTTRHPSNKTLRAEDLDRRINILHKWWILLLELLSGVHGQAISGTDRPAFLEAASTIMMREEWTAPGFSTAPGDSPQRPSISKSKSSNSLSSDDSDLLIETVYQNVRNTFVQTLLAQMALVVDKLSLRNATASLVTFGGKTCAYAFFYCPGVADLLCRLWRFPPGTLRRVFAALGAERGQKLDLVSKGLAAHFPPPIRSLCITNQAALGRHLLQRARMPPGTENINWFGPWTLRWSGRDSDLVFVFTKFYHLLAADFLVEDITPEQRVCIPGFAVVWAQVLTLLETTLYRQSNPHSMDNYSPGPGTGSDNPDASAMMPMTVANASRAIAENRLIMLLRDIAAVHDDQPPILRDLFIPSFDAIVKTATRRISVYNNEAAFILCDFMEEALPISFRYHQSCNSPEPVDWPFWLEVCKRMLDTENVLTKVRTIAFVYSMWNIFIASEEAKRHFIVDWLLAQSVFDGTFCHWSPMVRHYFYRLLCWRVARYDGPVSDVDMEILQTLAARVNKCWAFYQYLLADAEMSGKLPPSSAPCSPAPTRVMIIVRTDSQPVLSHPVPTFDGFIQSAVMNQSSPYQNHSSALNTIPSADQPTQSKKRWSILRGLNPFGSVPGNSRPGEVTPPGTPDERMPGESLPGPNSAVTHPKVHPRPVTPPHQVFSFKFSLEATNQRSGGSHQNRVLTKPQLPPNAERLVSGRQSSESRGSVASSGSESKIRARPGEVKPLKPQQDEMKAARYGGRALAEWSQVVAECRSFYLRRKQEGVPKDSLVENPTINVELFRSPG